MAGKKALPCQVAKVDKFQSAVQVGRNNFSIEEDQVSIERTPVGVMACMAGGLFFHNVKAMERETLVAKYTAASVAAVTQAVQKFALEAVVFLFKVSDKNRLVDRAMGPIWSCRIIIVVAIGATYQAFFGTRLDKAGHICIGTATFYRMK